MAKSEGKQQAEANKLKQGHFKREDKDNLTTATTTTATAGSAFNCFISLQLSFAWLDNSCCCCCWPSKQDFFGDLLLPHSTAHFGTQTREPTDESVLMERGLRRQRG